jgi:hypothetical protein
MLHRTLVFTGLLSLAAIPASGATNPFIGTWQMTTVASGIQLTVQLVLNPQGGFSELDQGISPTAGRMMTQETGTYALLVPNVLRLNVMNWPENHRAQPIAIALLQQPHSLLKTSPSATVRHSSIIESGRNAI